MNKYSYILVIYICLGLLTSCSTFATFYGDTATVISEEGKILRLDLSYQNLQVVPEQFNQLTQLRMLDLSGNTQLDIEHVLSKVSSPEKLAVLILDSLQLSQLPKNLSRFKNLTQLSLVHNPDLDWGIAFQQLENLPLVFLNLQRNNINSLPTTITKLSKLKDLKLSYNMLKDEQSYIFLSQLPNLYAVWLDFNELTVVPDNIGLLSQITYLYLDGNMLTDLPSSMRSMMSLSVIHLGYNKFSQLPERFMEMPKLLMVHINNNQITTIPRNYGIKKYALLALLLDGNPIPPEEVRWAKKALNRYFLLSFEQPVFNLN
jgi:Leucine-rich repeat (LRR) protein